MKKFGLFLLTSLSLLLAPQAVSADVTTFDSLETGSGYVAFGAGTGQVALEDYVMDLSSFGSDPGSVQLETLVFVGGVSDDGAVLDFNFYESSDGTGDVFSSFAVSLPSGGDFIWTITSSIMIPTAGSMEVVYDTSRSENLLGAGGRIFISQEASLTTGTSPENPFGIPDGDNPRTFAFQLNVVSAVPEPASAMVLGFAAVACGLTRRRRS